MIPEKYIARFIGTSESSNLNTGKYKWLRRIVMVVCIIIHLYLNHIQWQNMSAMNTNGILYQLKLMLTIILTLSNGTVGYIASLLLILISVTGVSVNVFIYGSYSFIPDIFVQLCAIIIVTIIYIYSTSFCKKIHDYENINNELRVLYEEISASEEELSTQNRQLMEYNRAISEKEKTLNYLAHFDILTELPNRKMIINRLNYLINLPPNSRLHFFVVFIDIDNFKRINDTVGHYTGDLLLQAVAKRLSSHINPNDILGRLGGDEFALIIQRQMKKIEIVEYVENLRNALLETFNIDNSAFSISASFGIAGYPNDGTDSTELLKSADTAMYKAKDSGRNSIQFFSTEMTSEILQSVEFENRLLASVKNNELFLVFQPQYTSDTKSLRGFEALVRWSSPELGLLSPAKFIPMAEETGYIVTMGRWILETALEKFKIIQDTYNTNLIISINISAVQIMEPSFVQMVKDVIKETGLDSKYIEFEITESVFIDSIDYVTNVLKELKEIGISIALDDFGIGYSSLSYLQKLPIDILKIDKSFVNSIKGTDKDDHQIIGAMISLVHHLNIIVIAEGVEEQSQLEYLKKHNCDYIQGYLLGKPVSGDNLTSLLENVDN